MPASDITAAVRNPAKAHDLATKGIQVRAADYGRPETIEPALAGTDVLLFISSPDVGTRQAQHRNVVDAAAKAGVSLVVYTSVLAAPSTTLALAADHKATEQMIVDSGLSYVFLRNSFYTEVYTGGLANALEHGTILGCAGDGRISGATRADFAAAAAAVIATHHSDHGRTKNGNVAYELGGDTPFTMADLATEVSSQTGKSIKYTNLPPADYAAALVAAGLPAAFADVLADASLAAGRGELYTNSGHLRTLIGRPTTPLADAVATALKS